MSWRDATATLGLITAQLTHSNKGITQRPGPPLSPGHAARVVRPFQGGGGQWGLIICLIFPMTPIHTSQKHSMLQSEQCIELHRATHFFFLLYVLIQSFFSLSQFILPLFLCVSCFSFLFSGSQSHTTSLYNNMWTPLITNIIMLSIRYLFIYETMFHSTLNLIEL